jgi:hypothetical protein
MGSFNVDPKFSFTKGTAKITVLPSSFTLPESWSNGANLYFLFVNHTLNEYYLYEQSESDFSASWDVTGLTGWNGTQEISALCIVKNSDNEAEYSSLMFRTIS